MREQGLAARLGRCCTAAGPARPQPRAAAGNVTSLSEKHSVGWEGSCVGDLVLLTKRFFYCYLEGLPHRP